MKIVILYSGGLDSFLMKFYAESKYPDAEVKCIYYKHGAESEKTEIEYLPEYVEVRRLDWLGDQIRPVAKKSDPFAGNIYIPGRNAVFTVLAAAQELPDQIWLGALWDEDNEQGTDKNERFRHSVSNLMQYVLSPFIDKVELRFPFVEEQWTKRKAVTWAIESGVDIDMMLNTNSCWHNDDGVPCGKCKQCLKRYLVMKSVGIEETYKVNPLEDPEQRERINQYIDKWRNGSPNADEAEMADMILQLEV